MAELAFDVLEQILVRMDVEDLLRCKSVCKSWLSFISTTRFVKAHLKHNINSDRDNRQLGHRRICVSSYSSKDWICCDKKVRIIGSCNGLLCLSPRGVRLVLTNPSTREHRELPMPPYWLHTDLTLITMAPGIIKQGVWWGFGYDPCADDYKVIAGFKNPHGTMWTTFYVLTLKSNTWKVIGDVRYRSFYYKPGILCGGALHWFMENGNNKNVIISLDLSTEKFNEIPLPDTADFGSNMISELKLGVLEYCLCICYRCWFSSFRMKKWVMKNKKWELYIDHCQTTYDVAHFIPFNLDSQNMCSLDDCTRVPSGQKYISASIFVKSLVSPHLHF